MSAKVFVGIICPMLLLLRPDDEYRPRVMLTGGGTPGRTEAMANTEVIDLGGTDHRWHRAEVMAHARYYGRSIP